MKSLDLNTYVEKALKIANKGTGKNQKEKQEDEVDKAEDPEPSTENEEAQKLAEKYY